MNHQLRFSGLSLPGRLKPALRPEQCLERRRQPYGAAPPVRSPLLILVASLAGVAAVEPEIAINDVVIEGASQIHPDKVRFVLDTRPGRSYTPTQLQQAVADDVKAIEKMGPFATTSAELAYGEDGRSVTVVYRLSELPYVVEVRWESSEKVVRRGSIIEPWHGQGPWEYARLGWFDQDKLKKLVEVRPGAWLNPLLLESDRRALLDKLHDEGSRYARVTVETPTIPGGVAVVFRVDTGQEVEVGEVVIEGLPDGITMNQFKPGSLNPQGLLNAKGRPYQSDLVPLDEGSVIRTFQDLGFLDAKLIRTRREAFDYVRPTDERRRHGPDLAPDGALNDRIVLVYTVEAGARYRLGKVNFVGNTVASSAALREAFRMPEGAWFKRLDLYGDGAKRARSRSDEGLGAIERSRRVISNQGYARCEARVDRRVDTAKHIVDVSVILDEGRPYDIGRVELHGNRVTRDNVPRRGLYLNPGDRWSDDESDESLRQIERSGVFNGPRGGPRPLRIEKLFPADRPDQVDLEVHVDEKSTGSLNFQLGYSTASGVFGSLGYTESNFDLWGMLSGGSFRGANQTLSGTVFASEDRTSISATWADPHLYDGPYSLSTTGFRTDNSSLEWRERRHGGASTVGRFFLRDDLSAALTYGYSAMSVNEILLTAPDDVVEGDYYWNTLGASLSYDRLNDRGFPTSGYLFSVGQTLNGVVTAASLDSTELAVKATGYLPLNETEDGGVTFVRLGARWKQLWGLNGSRQPPFWSRYRGGGAAPNHRGFEANTLSPTVINHRTNIFTSQNGYPAYQGGTIDGLATAEISYPIQGVNDGIRLVGFADLGNVWGQYDSVSPGDLRLAVGPGIRFPIALPVSLDFAFLLGSKAQNEAATQIHFGIGQVNF